MILLKIKTHLTHSILNLTLGMILIFLGWNSIKMGLANLHFYKAHQLTKQWQQNNAIQNNNDFEQALISIKTANKLHPNNPYYVITEALVYEWGAIQNVSDNNKAYLNKAKDHYLQAVQQRPTWPVTWATLAILKWRLGEFDQNMIDYLLQANKFGLNKPEVHEAWLEIGLFLYQQKSPLTSQIIHGLRKHLYLMLQAPKSRAKAIRIIKRHHAQHFTCRWINSYQITPSSSIKRLCD